MVSEPRAGIGDARTAFVLEQCIDFAVLELMFLQVRRHSPDGYVPLRRMARWLTKTFIELPGPKPETFPWEEQSFRVMLDILSDPEVGWESLPSTKSEFLAEIIRLRDQIVAICTDPDQAMNQGELLERLHRLCQRLRQEAHVIVWPMCGNPRWRLATI